MPESFDLRSISSATIPAAIEKAERYRLLGHPEEAESIGLDILDADASNQAGLVVLILAMTDQFPGENKARVPLALQYVAQLSDVYQRIYYEGVVLERAARADLKRGTSRPFIMERLEEAMDRYEQAAGIRPQGNDAAILRWNTCVRMIRRHQVGSRHTNDQAIPTAQA
jgi:hypothetical protein